MAVRWTDKASHRAAELRLNKRVSTACTKRFFLLSRWTFLLYTNEHRHLGCPVEVEILNLKKNYFSHSAKAERIIGNKRNLSKHFIAVAGASKSYACVILTLSSHSVLVYRSWARAALKRWYLSLSSMNIMNHKIWLFFLTASLYIRVGVGAHRH